MSVTDDHAHALVLIAEAKEALANGTCHYNKAGKLLPDIKSILTTLLDEEVVTLEPKPSQIGSHRASWPSKSQ